MSTTMERVMRERGDLHCLHEPFMHDYYLNPERLRPTRDMPFFIPQQAHPIEVDSIVAMILKHAESTPVFFKDMSYYLTPYLESHQTFFKRINHTFLIRNPKASIASYYAMDNAVTCEEIGYEALWLQLETLTQLGIEPIVLEAEAIQIDTQSVISNWWQRLGLSHVSDAFSWDSTVPDEWKQVQPWHRSTLASTSIRQRSNKDENAEQSRFDTAAIEAPHLQEYLEYHEPFYLRLRELA